MCTSIIEIARAEGMAKRGDAWFPLTQAVVAYDHARHAPLGDVITLDFMNTSLDAGARAGVELTLGPRLPRSGRPYGSAYWEAPAAHSHAREVVRRGRV